MTKHENDLQQNLFGEAKVMDMIIFQIKIVLKTFHDDNRIFEQIVIKFILGNIYFILL
jgi:hypothetical protein